MSSAEHHAVWHVVALDRGGAGVARAARNRSIDPNLGIIVHGHREYYHGTGWVKVADFRRDRERRAIPHERKVICGEHAAWHAEILARKLLADPAVPRIAFSGRHNADVDYVFIEWVDGRSLAELLVEPNHPSAPIAFARAGDLLAHIHSLEEPEDNHNMTQAAKAARYFGEPDFFDYFEPHLRIISDRFGRELALLIQDALRPIATSVEAHQRLAITHGDLQPKNLIVPQLRDGLNLIDWEFISFSPMWADLSQLLRHSPNSQVEGERESGYSSVQPMHINWRAFARAYDLVSPTRLGKLGRRFGH